MLAAEEVIPDTFFHGGHCGQCLELLGHLSQYSDSIILISGPVGIGKSALKQAFASKDKEKFSFLEVTAELNMDVNSVNIDAKFAEVIDKDVVLLIDDAQNLSPTSVTYLLNLKQSLNTAGRLQIVMFAEPDFAQQLQSKFTSQIHLIELEPLTLVEVKNFLLHLWKMAGNDSELPLTKANVKKIYSLSGGIPGAVQKIAQSMLAGEDINKSIVATRRLSPFAVGLTVSFGVLFCLLAFLWPAADDSVLQQAQPLIAEQNIEVAAQSQELAQLPPEQELLKQEPQDNVVENSPPANDEQLVRLENKIIELQTLLSTEQEARRIAEAKVQQFMLKSSPRKNPGKSLSILSKQEQRILDLPSKNYTLQLLGSSSEAKVKDFIKANKLESKVNYFKTSYQGKAWYILIYGNYSTRVAANAALATLPESIKKLQPWPRDYVSIQRTIKQK